MRSVEEMQAGLRSAMNEIQSIKDDLEQFKNAKTGGDLTADFKKISANAKRYPITPHPLSDTDEHTKKLYLTLLLSVAAYEPERLSDSLNFIHRIAYGCGYLKKGDLKEEFTSAQILTFDQLDEATGLFRENNLRLMLIAEMLLTAGAFSKGRGAAFEYISRMCQLLNVNRDETEFLSNMAAVVLTKDASRYKCNYLNTYPMFDVYLMDIEFPMEIFNCEFNERYIKENKTIAYSKKMETFHFKFSDFWITSDNILHTAALYSPYGSNTEETIENDISFPYGKRLMLEIETVDYLCRVKIAENEELILLEKKQPSKNKTDYSVSVGVLTSALCPENYPKIKPFYEKHKTISVPED